MLLNLWTISFNSRFPIVNLFDIIYIVSWTHLIFLIWHQFLWNFQTFDFDDGQVFMYGEFYLTFFHFWNRRWSMLRIWYVDFFRLSIWTFNLRYKLLIIWNFCFICWIFILAYQTLWISTRSWAFTLWLRTHPFLVVEFILFLNWFIISS